MNGLNSHQKSKRTVTYVCRLLLKYSAIYLQTHPRETQTKEFNDRQYPPSAICYHW